MAAPPSLPRPALAVSTTARPAPRRRGLTPKTAGVLLVLLVLAVFGRAVGQDFVLWDDQPLIWDNPHVNPPTWAGLAWHWRHGHLHMYIPAVYSAWWAIAHVARVSAPDEMGSTLNPYLFHAANVLLHATAALMVFGTLRRLLVPPDAADPDLAPLGDDPASRPEIVWAAMLGTAAFAVHPIQTEAVAWATGMKDVLSGALALAAVRLYVGGLAAPPRSRARRAQLGLASLPYAVALLAKPSVVVIPIFAWLIGVLWAPRRWRAAAPLLAGWVLAGVAVAVVASRVQPTNDIDDGPPWARPLIAADSVAFYLYKVAVPFNFCIDYGRRPAVVLGQHWAYWTWLLPAAAAAAIVASRSRRLALAGLVFVAGIAPVSGIVPFAFQFFTTVADRYVYLSMLGPAIAVALLAARRPGRGTRAALTAVALAWSALAFVQTGYWRDTATLMSHAVAVNPTSFSAHNNLGYVEELHGDLAGALEHYRASVRGHPGQFAAYNGLVLCLEQMGRFDESRQALLTLLDVNDKLPPNFHQDPIPLYGKLGQLDLKLGRYAEAADALRRVLHDYPDDVVVKSRLEQAESKLGATTRGNER